MCNILVKKLEIIESKNLQNGFFALDLLSRPFPPTNIKQKSHFANFTHTKDSKK